jgi:hypothetical protein
MLRGRMRLLILPMKHVSTSTSGQELARKVYGELRAVACVIDLRTLVSFLGSHLEQIFLGIAMSVGSIT